MFQRFKRKSALLAACLTLSSGVLANTVYIPGLAEGNSAQPFPPWNMITPDWADDPSLYVSNLKENETFEARGALIWIPVINYVTNEAAEAGAINPDHKTLFSNLLFGLISVETKVSWHKRVTLGKVAFREPLVHSEDYLSW